MNTNSKKVLIVIAIVIVALLLVWAVASRHGQVAIPEAPVASSTAPVASSSMPSTAAASSAPKAAPVLHSVPAVSSVQSIPQNVIAYSVSTDKRSYAQDEQIHITLVVTNTTNQGVTFASPNGCESDYQIGTFDMIEHTRCTPGIAAITVPAHMQEKFEMTHYPTVYRIPVGTYQLTASVVGGGSAATEVTITP